MISIVEGVEIPEQELQFTASRSSGPGGQYVNKVNSRVILGFPVFSSPSLTEEQKSRIAAHLHHRINQKGVLRLYCQRYRSQTANRRELLSRFADLLREALTEHPERKKTKIPRAVRERRLEGKKQRSEIKHSRKKSIVLED